jgi:hypothetical protein
LTAAFDAAAPSELAHRSSPRSVARRIVLVWVDRGDRSRDRIDAASAKKSALTAT